MANADVAVHAFDPTASGFLGAVVATATTNGAAALSGLVMVPPFDPFYIVEYTANAGTTDLSTGAAPVLTTLRTILTSTDIATATPIYATPQSTMADDLAVMNADSNVPPYTGNNDGTVTAQEFQDALAVASAQVASTVGFGMTGMDLFTSPPLLTDNTNTPESQAGVAAYRSAVEGLTAILAAMGAGGGGPSFTELLAALTLDLSDGVVDGKAGATDVPLMDAVALTAFAQDPTGLTIPGTTNTVGDVEQQLADETAATGVSVDTSGLNASTFDPNPAESDSDMDGDGALNVQDNCPADANADQANGDGDAAGDACDACPDDAGNDADGDGICAGSGFGDPATGDGDNCPADANTDQADGDGDDVGDACDACPNDADNDADGDGVCGDVDVCPGSDDNADADSDGTPDGCDVCPNDANDDADGDGVCGDVDVCPGFDDGLDADGDGLPDGCDACPADPNNDADADGVCGDVDNCPATANAGQTDTDSDGAGDACDVCPDDPTDTCAPDSDGDGIPDPDDACPDDAANDADSDGICAGTGFAEPKTGDNDNCPADANTDQADGDGDGVGDVCDNCPELPNPNQADADEDGTGDACEVTTTNPLVSVGGAAFQSVVEGSTLTVTLFLSGITDHDVTVTFFVNDTSATRTVDYDVPDTVVIPAGQISADIEVTTVDDTLDEGNEVFGLGISTVEGGMVDTNDSGIGVTIVDNDVTAPENRLTDPGDPDLDPTTLDASELGRRIKLALATPAYVFAGAASSVDEAAGTTGCPTLDSSPTEITGETLWTVDYGANEDNACTNELEGRSRWGMFDLRWNDFHSTAAPPEVGLLKSARPPETGVHGYYEVIDDGSTITAEEFRVDLSAEHLVEEEQFLIHAWRVRGLTAHSESFHGPFVSTQVDAQIVKTDLNVRLQDSGGVLISTFLGFGMVPLPVTVEVAGGQFTPDLDRMFLDNDALLCGVEPGEGVIVCPNWAPGSDPGQLSIAFTDLQFSPVICSGLSPSFGTITVNPGQDTEHSYFFGDAPCGSANLDSFVGPQVDLGLTFDPGEADDAPPWPLVPQMAP